jgi:Transposase DDE domain
VLADAGYWHKKQMENVVSDGIQVLVPPDAGLRDGARPGWEDGMYAFMRRVLSSEAGHALYKHRKASVEPVFAPIKFNRRINRFQRRGRAAALSELRLVAAAHNLLKLHSHWVAAETRLRRRNRTRGGRTRSRRPQRAARRENFARQPPPAAGRPLGPERPPGGLPCSPRKAGRSLAKMRCSPCGECGTEGRCQPEVVGHQRATSDTSCEQLGVSGGRSGPSTASVFRIDPGAGLEMGQA